MEVQKRREQYAQKFDNSAGEVDARAVVGAGSEDEDVVAEDDEAETVREQEEEGEEEAKSETNQNDGAAAGGRHVSEGGVAREPYPPPSTESERDLAEGQGEDSDRARSVEPG